MKKKKNKFDEYDDEENYDSFLDLDSEEEEEDIEKDSYDDFDEEVIDKKSGKFLSESFLRYFDDAGNTIFKIRNGEPNFKKPSKGDSDIVSILTIIKNNYSLISDFVASDYTYLPNFYKPQNQKYELDKNQIDGLINVLKGKKFSKQKYLKEILSFFNQKDISSNKIVAIKTYVDGEVDESDLTDFVDNSEDVVNIIEIKQEFEIKSDIFSGKNILNIERICHIKENDESLPNDLKPFEKHLKILNPSAIKRMATSADLKLNFIYKKNYRED